MVLSFIFLYLPFALANALEKRVETLISIDPIVAVNELMQLNDSLSKKIVVNS